MIEIGDVLTLSTQVYDTSTPPALADGGVVTAAVTLPDGTAGAALTVTHPSTGNYSAVYTVVQSGPHTITWTVTGANAGTWIDSFYVESPAIGIVSLAEVKAHLRITRSTDDEMLRTLILAASDLCESAEGTGRTYRRTVVTNELHTSGGQQFIAFNRRPVASVTALSIDGAVQTVADYDVDTWAISNPNGVFSSSLRRNNVSISYIVAPTQVPAAVRDGVKEMVRHLYAIQRGGSNLPRQEEPDYTESAGYLIPNRVAVAWRAHSTGF